MRAWPLLLLLVSCTSASATAFPPDSGPDDAGAPSLPPNARSLDASSEAAPSDAGSPQPLQVICGDGPCYVAVSGNGGRHVCGLLQAGTVQCWGRDTQDGPVMLDGGALVSDGALGRGAPVSVLEGAVPAPVAGLSKVTQISVGPNLGSCARTSDGAVYCWGRNDFGQLGRPPAEPRLPVPMRIEGLPPVDEVKLGYRAGCAIASSDRAVYCWGSRGSSGFAPPAVEAAFRPPVKSLAIGNWGSANDTIIGLLEGNILSTIGDHGIRGESIVNKTEKANVSWIGPYAYATTEGLFRRWAPIDESLYVPSIAPIIDVKISGETSNSNSVQGGALTVRGRLFRWGPNATGALGRHPYELTAAAYPVEVQQVREKVVSFATTVVSTCASLVDGTVQCWGGNASGELGRGTVDFDPHPEPEVIVR